jgi:hypothetical protein
LISSDAVKKETSLGVELQTGEAKVECFVASRLAIGGIRIIAESYTRDELTCQLIAIDLMRECRAIGKGIGVVRTRDLNWLAVCSKRQPGKQDESSAKFHRSYLRTRSERKQF